jgi:hypothetical protein
MAGSYRNGSSKTWRRVGGKVAVCAGDPVVFGIIRNLKLFRPEIVTQFHRARTASETLRHLAFGTGGKC